MLSFLLLAYICFQARLSEVLLISWIALIIQLHLELSRKLNSARILLLPEFYWFTLKVILIIGQIITLWKNTAFSWFSAFNFSIGAGCCRSYLFSKRFFGAWVCTGPLQIVLTCCELFLAQEVNPFSPNSVFPESSVTYGNRILSLRLNLPLFPLLEFPPLLDETLFKRRSKRTSPLYSPVSSPQTSEVEFLLNSQATLLTAASCSLAREQTTQLLSRPGRRFLRLPGWTCFALLATIPECRRGIMQLLCACSLTVVLSKVGFKSWTVCLFVHPWAFKLVVNGMNHLNQAEGRVNFLNWKIFSTSD